MELAQAIQQAHHRPPTVLSLQNGVGNEEAIASALGSASVIAGVITTPVSVLEAAVIHVDKPRYTIGVSPWHPAVPFSVLDATQTALVQAGFTVTLYPNARGLKWTKLLMNMLGNASSAVLDMPPQEVFADSMLVDLEIEAWREALAVMKASRIPPVNMGHYPFGLLSPLVQRLPKATLRPILRAQVAGARGGKMPSLHIDLHSGKKRSEVAWLNGAVARKGEQLNVATPVNRLFYEILSSLLGDEQQQSLWRRNAVRLVVTAGEYRTANR
jgi:2-dehydropantoate 2-reductase